MRLVDLNDGESAVVRYGGFGDGAERTYIYKKIENNYVRTYSEHLRDDGTLYMSIEHNPPIKATPNPMTPCEKLEMSGGSLIQEVCQ